jgi:sortase A
MPWERGNSAVAGHRDGLFRPLKNVKIGDEIRFRTTRREFRYRVTRTAIVKPDDLSVLAPQAGPATLTLITCYPFSYVGTAPERFVVHAAREQAAISP